MTRFSIELTDKLWIFFWSSRPRAPPARSATVPTGFGDLKCVPNLKKSWVELHLLGSGTLRQAGGWVHWPPTLTCWPLGQLVVTRARWQHRFRAHADSCNSGNLPVPSRRDLNSDTGHDEGTLGAAFNPPAHALSALPLHASFLLSVCLPPCRCPISKSFSVRHESWNLETNK